MFFRMDEDLKSKRKWGATDSALDGLAAAMLVTILLDLWRITVGSIVQIEGAVVGGGAGLPWMT